MEVTSAESFLAYYERIGERTLRVAACIPRDRLEWRHLPGHGRELGKWHGPPLYRLTAEEVRARSLRSCATPSGSGV